MEVIFTGVIALIVFANGEVCGEAGCEVICCEVICCEESVCSVDFAAGLIDKVGVVSGNVGLVVFAMTGGSTERISGFEETGGVGFPMAMLQRSGASV